MIGNSLFRKERDKWSRNRVSATRNTSCAMLLVLGVVVDSAQASSCSTQPTDFAYQFVQQLANGIDPEQLYGKLSRQTKDSVSPEDVKRLQSALQTSHGKPTFFKGPIEEPSATNDYAQISFLLESGNGSGLSRLTLVVHCIDQSWFVAGIRLAASN